MRILAAFALTVLLCHCGGNTSLGTQPTRTMHEVSPNDTNLVELIVDPGPAGLRQPYTNGLFATITLCVPGTTDCQDIDHMLVDTGSVGVRVLESEITITLPEVTDSAGAKLAGCAPFVDGVAWGPIKTADVRIGGESAAGISIQTIGVRDYTVPTRCAQAGPAVNDLQSLGCKGILGVGIYREDCGTDCAPGAGSNAGLYYACTSAGAGGCTKAQVPIAKQVANPVANFPVNNNGSFIQLPSVPLTGAPVVPGLMVFGIGTQANNGLGEAQVIALSARGFSTTAFPAGGKSYTSFIDSGSNGLFFLDASTTGLKLCANNPSQFYCPPSGKDLNATMLAQDGSHVNVIFNVANAAKLAASASAFSNLAGPMPGFPDPMLPGFDWGLPFYFGREVFTSIEGGNAPGGLSPYFAF